MANLLVIDDDPMVSRFLSATLRASGYEPRHVETFDEARRILLDEPFDLVVCDVHLDAGHTGLELLSLRQASPSKPQFVFVTGDAELETAVEALRAGAFDYVPKPIDTPRLLLAVARALQARAPRPAGPAAVDTTERLIGHTAPIVEVFNSVGRASAVDSPVLLVGEDGVGKEQVAREIHRHSPRAAWPFVVADAFNFAEVGDLLARELYYVVSAIEVAIPPLRARRDDIPLLVDHVLTRISPRVRRDRPARAREVALGPLPERGVDGRGACADLRGPPLTTPFRGRSSGGHPLADKRVLW